jgi:hypothetical protein
MYLKWGTVGKGKKGTSRKGRWRGGQCTANQGSEWTGIRSMSKRRDFQVSKRGVQGIRVGVSKQRGSSNRIGACTSVYHANRVYIMLRKDCV